MLCSLPVLLEEARLRVGALSVGRAELLEVFSWDRETVGVRVREVLLWIKVLVHVLQLHASIQRCNSKNVVFGFSAFLSGSF